jgi:hypothetical protein
MKKVKKLGVITLIIGLVGGIIYYLYKKGKLPYMLPVPPSQQ